MSAILTDLSARDGLKPEVLGELIGEIYDCALNPEGWSGALTRIAAFTNSAYATIALSDPALTKPVMLAHSPWDPGMLRRLSEEFSQEIPGALEVIEGDLDTPRSTMALMSEDDFQKTRFYRDWVAPQGLRDGCIMKFVQTNRRLGLMVFVTHASRGLITEDERRFVQVLSPHMRRSALIGDLLEQSRISVTAYKSALDGLATPVFLTNPEGRIRHVNGAADKILRESRCLTSVNGVLSAISIVARPLLQDAIQRASQCDPTVLGQHGIGLPLTTSGEDPVAAYVLPLRAGAAGGATAAVVLSLQDSHMPPTIPMLVTLFDLTPAEARVMTQAGEGRNLADIAASLSISENTLKTHLTRVYSKTGTSRQAELVALLASLGTR